FLLTHEVTDQPGTLSMRVRMGRLEEDTAPLERGVAGFRAGIRGRESDYRDSAVYGIGLNAGIAADGRLFIGKLEPDAPRVPEPFQNLELALQAVPTGTTCQIHLAAIDAEGKVLADMTREGVPSQWLTGGVALVCSSSAVDDSPDESAVVVTM